MPNQGPAQDYGAQAWQANQGASQGVPAKPSGSVYTGSNSMDVTAGKFRYPLNDPGFAVQNALRSMGVSPMSMNPYTQSLMQTAPALMSAFVSNAGSGYSPGADIGNAFGGLLKNVIGGGSVDSVLQNAAQSFPGMIDAVRGFNQQFASNPDLGEMMNPLMATLASMVSQNGGQGGIQLLQALMGGLLPRAVAGPYNQYLGAAGSAARDRLLQESNFTSPTDIFSYLFK